MDPAPHGSRMSSLTPTATNSSQGLARVAGWGVQ
jgi:hypothetical protein